MTNEEAIFILKCVEAHGIADEAKMIAMSALEKQIPKKPVYTETQCVKKLDCPNCRSNIYYIQYGTLFSGIKCHYCCDCGQKIDWNEGREEE